MSVERSLRDSRNPCTINYSKTL